MAMTVLQTAGERSALQGDAERGHAQVCSFVPDVVRKRLHPGGNLCHVRSRPVGEYEQAAVNLTAEGAVCVRVFC